MPVLDLASKVGFQPAPKCFNFCSSGGALIGVALIPVECAVLRRHATAIVWDVWGTTSKSTWKNE